MTIGEIMRYAKGYENRFKRDLKIKAQFDYVSANYLGNLVNLILSGKGKKYTLAECYPSLFEEDQEQKQQQSIARFIAFANQHNSKIKGGNKND